MPDAATMAAARPKCPGAASATKPVTYTGCGEPLTYSVKLETWTCPTHGDVLTAQIASLRVEQLAA